MESISNVATQCLTKFARLAERYEDAKQITSEQIGELEREYSRYKVWCGNLDVLQSGRSSLEYQLRELTTMKTTVFSHLVRLDQALTKILEIISGDRLPLELQQRPEMSSDESSEDEDQAVKIEIRGPPPPELAIHIRTVHEILADLYKIGFRIRNNSTKPVSLTPSLYKDIDKKSGEDKLEAYTQFDRKRIEDTILQARRNVVNRYQQQSPTVKIMESDVWLVDRLANTISKRRRTIRYWQKQSEELVEARIGPPDPEADLEPTLQSDEYEPSKISKRDEDYESGFSPPLSVREDVVASPTNATPHRVRFEGQFDTASRVSYASTTSELSGRALEILRPPANALFRPEFICSYCGLKCPSVYALGKSWKLHIMQDIQPYICTYEQCESAYEMYSSSTMWLEHERLVHCRAWKCFEHADCTYLTKSALESHLKSAHSDQGTMDQLESLLDVSAFTVVDTRTRCPVCHLEGPFNGSFNHHMAFHLETFALLSVSGAQTELGNVDDALEERQSNHNHDVGSKAMSQDLSELSELISRRGSDCSEGFDYHPTLRLETLALFSDHEAPSKEMVEVDEASEESNSGHKLSFDANRPRDDLSDLSSVSFRGSVSSASQSFISDSQSFKRRRIR